MQKNYNIGVFGHYGNQNLGDEAIITAVIQNIRSRLPNAELCCFSINPEDTSNRYNIPAYPIRNFKPGSKISQPAQSPDKAIASTATAEQSEKHTEDDITAKQKLKNLVKAIPIVSDALRWLLNTAYVLQGIGPEIRFLRQSGNILKDIDLLMICGSNQFLDNFGGAWGFPYTLLKWTLLARMNDTKVAFVSVGAGPLDLTLSKFFIKHALNKSHYCSFRDPGSRALIERTRTRKTGSVYPDLAHSLIRENNQTNTPPQMEQKPTIGINPMPVYDQRYWPEADAQKYHQFVDNFARFSKNLVEQGYPIYFFATQPKDEGVINDILIKLQKDKVNFGNLNSIIRRCGEVDDLLDIMASADIIVATRFHGVLLSLFLSIPVVAVCYGRKTHELMVDMGQADYSMDLDGLDVAEMLEKFNLLTSNRVAEIENITKRESFYKKSLQEQYNNILTLLAD